MCHLTLSTRNTNTKTSPKLTTTTRLTRRLFLNSKNQRFSGKKSCGTTWLHFLLCYGHFCVIWPFCSLQNMGQCFHWDFFTIFTYFLISDISPFHTRKTHRLQRKFCFLSLLSCYFMLSAIQFCQFLFMSSLCKLSFHPEMEFSFMLKLLLSFCHLVSYRLLLQKIILYEISVASQTPFTCLVFLIFVQTFCSFSFSYFQCDNEKSDSEKVGFFLFFGCRNNVGCFCPNLQRLHRV